MTTTPSQPVLEDFTTELASRLHLQRDEAEAVLGEALIRYHTQTSRRLPPAQQQLSVVVRREELEPA